MIFYSKPDTLGLVWCLPFFGGAAENELKKRTKTILNIVVLVVLIGITMTVLLLNYRELNFTNIKNFLVSGNKWCIAAAFIFMILSVAFEGLSLWYIARRLGHKSKLRSSMAYSSADVYYSAITPSASGGQPASMFYMVRDGMSAGTAALTLAINVMSYAAAIIVLGAFAFIVRPEMFAAIDSTFSKVLIILGSSMQLLLIGFCILCIAWSTAVLKVGNGCISFLHKIKIIKKPDKWRDKLIDEVEKYRISRKIIRQKPSLLIVSILLNIAQRVSHTLITCFVCFAVSPDPSLYIGSLQPNFLDLFAMQVFVLLGYNSVPLPGGVGAFEYLYLNVYGEFFVESYIMSAMMISRFISYYLRMIGAAIYTLIYHSIGIGKSAKAAEPTAVDASQTPTPTMPETSGETEITAGDGDMPESETAEVCADGVAAATEEKEKFNEVYE